MKKKCPDRDDYRGHRLDPRCDTATATCVYCFKTFTHIEMELRLVKRCSAAVRAARCREEVEANAHRMTEIVAVSGMRLSPEDGRRFQPPVFFIRDPGAEELREPTQHEIACLLWRCWRVRP
jgi:hypothetical protein